MRSFEELEASWLALALPQDVGAVQFIVLRKEAGNRECVSAAILDPQRGVVGDKWADGANPNVDAQVTLMNVHVAELLAHDTHGVDAPGDNLLVNFDLSETQLPAGTRLQVGTAMLQVTAEPHLGCQKFSERFGPEALKWVNWKPHRVRRLRGMNCRVLEEGAVAIGDTVKVLRD